MQHIGCHATRGGERTDDRAVRTAAETFDGHHRARIVRAEAVARLDDEGIDRARLLVLRVAQTGADLHRIGDLVAEAGEGRDVLDRAVVHPLVLARERGQRAVAARDHRTEEVLTPETVGLLDVVLLEVGTGDPVEPRLGVVRGDAELLAELRGVHGFRDGVREQELAVVGGGRARAVLRVHERDVLLPPGDAPTERLRTGTGLVIELGALAAGVAGQRVEHEAVEVLRDVEREVESVALHVLRGRRGVALIGDVVGDVHARIGEIEEGAQVAPRARAIGTQIARLAVLVAAVDGDHVDAVVAVFVIAKDGAGGDAAVAAVIEQLGAGLKGVVVVDVTLVQRVVRETIPLAVLHREAARDGVGEATGDIAREELRAVVAETSRDRPGVVELRLRGRDRQRAAHHILAEQHALRAADDLDPLEVEEVVVEVAGAAHVDAVDEGADRRIGGRRVEAGVGDAADVELDIERRAGGQREAGHGGGEVAGREQLGLGDGLAGIGADGDRRGLQRGLAALGRHHNLFEALGEARRGSAGERHHHGGGGQRGDCA